MVEFQKWSHFSPPVSPADSFVRTIGVREKREMVETIAILCNFAASLGPARYVLTVRQHPTMFKGSIMLRYPLASSLLTVIACAPRVDQPTIVNTISGDMAARAHATMLEFVDDGFSGALVAAVGGDIVLDVGYGFADREQQVPFTSATVAQIGSNTKSFTALAIIDLHLKGKLDLDRSVATYLPQASEPARNVTLSQLLTHTSGMAEYCGNDLDPMTRDEFIATCTARPLRFDPGSDREYSNPGYTLLAVVAEVVSGQELGGYLWTELFSKHDVPTLGYLPPAGITVARGYLNDDLQPDYAEFIREQSGNFWTVKGAGGMHASAMDMYHWYRALSGRDDLNPAIIDMTLNPPSRSENGGDGYGWGLARTDDGRVTRVSHAGSDGTFFCYFWWNPDADRFFYLIGNSGEDIATDATRAVLKIIRGDDPA